VEDSINTSKMLERRLLNEK